jgi:hypothetical protein
MGLEYIEPFVLQGRIALVPEPEPAVNEFYDPLRQLWVDSVSGSPLVTLLSDEGLMASRFGETQITETREGADQSEITSLSSSKFGETTFTRRSEGEDQAEPVGASRFGETTVTKTQEGTDAIESASARAYAAHSHL